MSAADIVLRWADLYTRGLDPVAAGDRVAELESDLWEHAAAEPGARAAILSRAIRGIPADLAWRHEQRTAARMLLPRSQRIVGNAVTALVALAASALIALGLVAIARTAYAVTEWGVRPWSETAVWVIGLTGLAVAGAALLLRRRTRALGAIVLAAASPVVHFALYDLYNKSATIIALSNASTWAIAITLVMASLMLLFVSAAVLWLPARKATA